MRTTHRVRRRISLSGAGFLGAWHLGVATALKDAGALEGTEIAGASAGALVGASIVTNVELQHARDVLRDLALRTRSQPMGMLTPGFSLVSVVREALDLHLPSDAHRLATGRLHVALTSLRPEDFGQTCHKAAFASRDELIDAVCASSDIPGLTGTLRAPAADASADASAASSAGATAALPASTARLLQEFLRRRDVDGGLFDIFPDPWCDGDTVFVSPFAGTGFDICPHHMDGAPVIPEWSPICPSKNGRMLDLTQENLRRWRDAFLPPAHQQLLEYEARGYERSNEWLAAQGYVEVPPRAAAVEREA